MHASKKNIVKRHYGCVRGTENKPINVTEF